MSQKKETDVLASQRDASLGRKRGRIMLSHPGGMRLSVKKPDKKRLFVIRPVKPIDAFLRNAVFLSCHFLPIDSSQRDDFAVSFQQNSIAPLKACGGVEQKEHGFLKP